MNCVRLPKRRLPAVSSSSSSSSASAAAGHKKTDGQTDDIDHSDDSQQADGVAAVQPMCPKKNQQKKRAVKLGVVEGSSTAVVLGLNKDNAPANAVALSLASSYFAEFDGDEKPPPQKAYRKASSILKDPEMTACRMSKTIFHYPTGGRKQAMCMVCGRKCTDACAVCCQLMHCEGIGEENCFWRFHSLEQFETAAKLSNRKSNKAKAQHHNESSSSSTIA